MIDNSYVYSELTDKIIGSSIEVHKALGPVLLESAYKECLAYELIKQGLIVNREHPLPLIYHEIKLEYGYKGRSVCRT